MPQNPSPVIDLGAGGNKSALNVIAAGNIKSSPGRLARVVVINPGSAGNLAINDALSGNSAASQIFNEPFSALVAGQVLVFDWPCSVGIRVGSMPTGGAINVSYI